MDAVKIPRGTAKQAVAPRNLAPGQFLEATNHTNEIFIERLQKFDEYLSPALIIQDVFDSQIVSSLRTGGQRRMKAGEKPSPQIRRTEISSPDTRHRQHPGIPKVVN
jgi:hypothetical protein